MNEGNPIGCFVIEYQILKKKLSVSTNKSVVKTFEFTDKY